MSHLSMSFCFTMGKKKSNKSAPVYPLPKDHALLASQHDTMQSKKAQGQWNNEQKPLSGLKEFPNGNSSLMKSEIPLFHHKTASKNHAWIKDKPGSGDHKGTVSTNDMCLNWATPKERSPGLLNCKKMFNRGKQMGLSCSLVISRIWERVKQLHAPFVPQQFFIRGSHRSLV